MEAKKMGLTSCLLGGSGFIGEPPWSREGPGSESASQELCSKHC
jgi:hypothetical protein